MYRLEKQEKIMTRMQLGLTEVHLNTRMGIVSVEHRGNMGNTIDRDVRPHVDKMLGAGVFDALRANGNEGGSADYMYTLTAPISTYLEAKGS